MGVVEPTAEPALRHVTTRAPGRPAAAGPVVGARVQAGDPASLRGSLAISGEIVEERRGIVSAPARRSGSGPMLAGGESSSTVVERERVPLGVVVAAAVLISIIAAAWLGMPPPPPQRPARSSVEELKIADSLEEDITRVAAGASGVAPGEREHPGEPAAAEAAGAGEVQGALGDPVARVGAGEPEDPGGETPAAGVKEVGVEPPPPSEPVASEASAAGAGREATPSPPATASVLTQRRLRRAAEEATDEFNACVRKTVLLGEEGFGMSVVIAVEDRGQPSSAALVRVTERKLPPKLGLRELPKLGKACVLEQLRTIRVAAAAAAEITHTYQMR